MPNTIRILNWNIQNFGETKAGLLHNNGDVVAAIAQIVIRSNADIFVMLEMNTTNEQTARRLAEVMRRALHNLSPADQPWDLAVLSPLTGREFYAFFIRDRETTVPLTIAGPINPFTDAPLMTLTAAPLDVSKARFRAPAAEETGVLQSWFPLLMPDLPHPTTRTLRTRAPKWPGTRRAVLGLFYVRSGKSGSLLPIVACHYIAEAKRAARQFDVLPDFSILRGLTSGMRPPGQPAPKPVRVRVDPDGGGYVSRALNYFVLTGDFNADYTKRKLLYAPIEKSGMYQLGATSRIGSNTFLMNYDQYDSRLHKTTAALAIRNYDNFFFRIAPKQPVAAQAAPGRVYDVPELVRNRDVELCESVDRYKELDQRGFHDLPYEPVVTNFSNQLTGDKSIQINLLGSLMGARLISDHLPTLLTLTV